MVTFQLIGIENQLTKVNLVLNYLPGQHMQCKIAIVKNLTDKSVKSANKEFQPNNYLKKI